MKVASNSCTVLCIKNIQVFNRIPVLLVALQYVFRRQNQAGRNSSLSLGRGLWPNPSYGRRRRKGGRGRKKKINQIIREWRQTVKK
jgi:hypothetical protein